MAVAYILILFAAVLEKNGIGTGFISDQRIHEFFQSSHTYEYIDISGEHKTIQL